MKKLVSMVLTVGIAACSSSPSSPVPSELSPAVDASPPPAVILPDAGAKPAADAGDLNPGLGHDAGDQKDAAAPVADASPPLVDAAVQDATDAAPPDYTACIQQACANYGANCGVITALAPGGVPVTCGGHPVDCGTCGRGQMCGDNGRPNKCGNECQNVYSSYCAQVGVPSAWGVLSSCNNGAPYNVDEITGAVLDSRASGLAGCVYHQVNPFALSCCPP